VAPVVAEVVAIEPEPDMLAEGQRRARNGGRQRHVHSRYLG
jgi:hypothetical protein